MSPESRPLAVISGGSEFHKPLINRYFFPIRGEERRQVYKRQGKSGTNKEPLDGFRRIYSSSTDSATWMSALEGCALAQTAKRKYDFYEFEIYPGIVHLDMASRSKKSRKQPKVSAEKILTAALNRAEVEGWQNIRLHDIADDLGTSLPAVREHFSDQDAIANAWFRKSLEAMLAPTEKAFRALPPKQRLFLVVMRWFDAMAAHRRVTVQMIRTKMYLGHPHHWVPLFFNLSRLVQWIREAAFLDAQGRQRQIEEIGLTTLVVTTLGYWVTDQSEDQDRTKRFFYKRLETGDRIMSRLFRSSAPETRPRL